jgi:predicted RNA-binding protein with PUA-like domain
MPQHWLFKTEPGTYSFQQFLKDGKTNWNGVRNFQARNYLRQISVGDLVLIYHSGKEKAIVGTAEVIREHYADLDPKVTGDWVQIDLKAGELFHVPVTLQQIKSEPELKEMLLLRQSRLSVLPVSASMFTKILTLGGLFRK